MYRQDTIFQHVINMKITEIFHCFFLQSFLTKKEMATHSSGLAWRISMDRGVWWATFHGVTKSQTRWTTKHIFSKSGLHNMVTYLSLDCQNFKSHSGHCAGQDSSEIGSYKPGMAFEAVTWPLSLVSWLVRTIMSACIFSLSSFFLICH